MAKASVSSLAADETEVLSITTNNPVRVGNKNSTFWTDESIKGSNTIKGLKLYYSQSYGGVKFKADGKTLFVVPTANIPQYQPKD
jgi:hypothetical protein